MYQEIISPLLGMFDSETMHVKAREALHLAEQWEWTLKGVEWIANRGHDRFTDPRLNVNFLGLDFDNPTMVGAGWDKYGRAVEALYRADFSGVEVGTVPLRPQDGNDKPRQWMITPVVSDNALGFNSPGAMAVSDNLFRYLGRGFNIGISLGINKDVTPIQAPEAHAKVLMLLAAHASYAAINVSSPNTKGLRALQDRGPLTDIVQAVTAVRDDYAEESGRRIPLLIKIAPDLSVPDTEVVVEVALDNGIDGLIATNTTNSPEIKAKYGPKWANIPGGAAGDDPDFRRMATEKIALISFCSGKRLPIIGVGGVSGAESAYEKIKAGASLVQVVTGIRGKGITVAHDINTGLLQLVVRDGLKNISQAVGVETLQYKNSFAHPKP